ncbi:MAG: MMPL family transporter [Cytophagales bacterium]|nr:MMPL family transporter [Cytophagales bacterium]
MWTTISHFIIKKRLWLMLILGVVTVFMGIQARKSELSFRFAELIPQTHKEMVYFREFKKTFGSDANIMVIGFKDSSLYKAETFQHFQKLNQQIQATEGVTNVISLSTLQYLQKNKSKRIFESIPLFDSTVANQQELDEKLSLFGNLEFYKKQIINPDNGATAIAITIKQELVDSPQRTIIIKSIQEYVVQFSEKTNIKAHFAGIPYVRTELSAEVKRELSFFLYASLAITALVLFLFFRSFYAVIFPVLVIGVAVIWVSGTVVLFDYKITGLTGLVPPIIVVIGIPNCIYLLNKYHQEYARHGNKIKALSTVLRKIGVVTLITNMTTAIGFLVLISANITVLKEFGLIAGINVLSTFVISMILIPGVFTYLPPPSPNQLKHLDLKLLNKVLQLLETLVLKNKKWTYIVTSLIIGFSAYGALSVKANSHMVDDIPKEHYVKQGLHFFEENFSGVMPLEIVINTKNKYAIRDLKIIQKIDALGKFIEKQPEFSRPLSFVNFLKATKQAYFNNHPDFYDIPSKRDRIRILSYLRKTAKVNEETNGKSNPLKSLVDSTGKIRVSIKTADIGSAAIESLVKDRMIPFADSLFSAEKPYDSYQNYHEAPYRITGTTLLFSRGNHYLINNLRESLFIAIFLIAVIMGSLFRNVRIVLISLIPNIIPLLMTAALMGYFDIALKPSTALIFSIAFGISVDDSIHFLAKYKQELDTGLSNRLAVLKSLKETGASMIYTSIILFAGFIIFTASSFLGTVMLGLLTSTTLLIAMVSNLIVLPSLLLTFEKKE